MKVSIFGLGYVGIVTAGCFARDGIHVIGVDINPEKINNINKGIPPIIEKGLKELIDEGLQQGRITATLDINEAIQKTDVSLISVGTPSRNDGALDLQYVERVVISIAKTVALKKKAHTVIIRSTIFPGTTRYLAGLTRKYAKDIPLHFAFNPEFLREGSAIKDFDEAPFTVIGTESKKAESYVRKLYATVDAPVFVVKPEEAELLKYAANAWHATKIGFSNEIGRLAKFSNVDARKVMEMLVLDKKLNISTAYMKPGFAYGGSCLPKDVRAIEYFGKINNINLPIINALPQSNNAHIELALDLIIKKNKRKLGLLGLSFKSDTDDLRESPAVELSERLLGKGYDLKILDHYVSESKLIGSNKAYIEKKIPHLSRLMVETPNELLEHAEVIIVTHGAAEFRTILDKNNNDAIIIDLTGILKEDIEYAHYEGIAW
jgi:GDP-mannose 6-dehydrogenase